MSTEHTTTKKTFIFIAGYAFYKLQDIANGIGTNLTHSVCISAPEPNSIIPSRNLQNNSIFFSQIMFYSALPSRRNIIIVNPDLNKKFILQVLMLCDKINKDVFIIIDNAFHNESYPDLTINFPGTRIIYTYKHNFIYKDKKQLFKNIAHEINHNRQFYPGDSYMFNNLISAFPLVFRDTLNHVLFGNEFGDIPFEKLNKSLLPIFDEVADEEEGIEKEVNLNLKVDNGEEEDKENEIKKLMIEEPKKEDDDDDEIINEDTLDNNTNTIDNYFFPLASFKDIKLKKEEEEI